MSTPEISLNVMHPRSVEVRSAAWRAAMLALSVTLFAVVLALAFVVEKPHSGILHLHAVPIAIIALQIGIMGGLGAAACSLSLMFVWAEVEGIELLLFDYMSGAVLFVLVVFLCQAAFRRRHDRDETAAQVTRLQPVPLDPAKELTGRESEVLGLLALGHTNREIAEQLVLSIRTVESHRARIQRKLSISSRAELVRHAVERDLLQLTAPAAAPAA
jgi:DNA-binding CsgD family transcriptional regulator